MIANERYRLILDLLGRKQRILVRALQKIVKTSPATLRRDLTTLERAKKLVRAHGAILHPNFFSGEPTFAERQSRGLLFKKTMASAAVELLPLRSTVFIDSGTSCFEAGRLLCSRADLTLITNSIPLLSIATRASAKVISIGGEIRHETEALIGSLSLKWLNHLTADWAFIGATGLSDQDGISTTELSEASVKQEFLRRSRKRILLADGTKWNQTSVVRFADWKDFDYWVTTRDVPAPEIKRISQMGVKVIRAKGSPV